MNDEIFSQPGHEPPSAPGVSAPGEPEAADEAYEPVEPSFQELPPLAPDEPEDTYATGRVPRPGKHPLIFLLVALFVITLIALGIAWPSQAHYETISPSAPGSSADAGALPTAFGSAPPDGDEPDELLCLSPAGEALDETAVYEIIGRSLVVVLSHENGGEQVSTGVVLTEDGYILAHADLSSYADDVSVLAPDGVEYEASLVGLDQPTELLVLKIEAHGLTPAQLGDSAALTAGQSVLAIGNPFGRELSGTMVPGMISAVSENVSVGGVSMTVLQTNIPLLSAGTGGLLLNSSAQVIGVGVSTVAGVDSALGVSFALPMHETKRLVSDLMRYGCVSGRATLGLEVSELSVPQRLYWDLPEGVMVERVAKDSSAYAVGIRPGDVLLTLDGEALRRVSDYVTLLNARTAGEVVHITLYRSGSYYYADILLLESVPSEQSVPSGQSAASED